MQVMSIFLHYLGMEVWIGPTAFGQSLQRLLRSKHCPLADRGRELGGI